MKSTSFFMIFSSGNKESVNKNKRQRFRPYRIASFCRISTLEGPGFLRGGERSLKAVSLGVTVSAPLIF